MNDKGGEGKNAKLVGSMPAELARELQTALDNYLKEKKREKRE